MANFDDVLLAAQGWGNNNACPVAHGDTFGQRPPVLSSIPTHLDFWLIVWPPDDEHENIELELGAKDIDRWQALCDSIADELPVATIPEPPQDADEAGWHRAFLSVNA